MYGSARLLGRASSSSHQHQQQQQQQQQQQHAGVEMLSTAGSSRRLAGLTQEQPEREREQRQQQRQQQQHQHQQRHREQQQEQEQPLADFTTKMGGIIVAEDTEKLDEYRRALETLKAASNHPSQRNYSIAFTALIAVVVGVVIIVVIYLFTRGDDATDANSVRVREICNSENVDLCMEGLREQLKDDTTAALRSPIHYIFTFAAFVVTLLIFLCSMNRKHALKRRILASLPNDEVDLWSHGKKRPYQSLNFNADMQSCIEDCIFKARLLKDLQLMVAEQEVVQGKTPCRDPNWGYIESAQAQAQAQAQHPGTAHASNAHGNLTKVNFKHYTAGAYEYLSEIAARQNKENRIMSWETVSEYIARLKERCPGIDPFKCDEFVALYEQAKFGEADFDSGGWERIRNNLDYMNHFFSQAG